MLRIYCKQLGEKETVIPVDTAEQAANVIVGMARIFFLFCHENYIGHTNIEVALQVLKDGEWVDWIEEETGYNIYEYIDDMTLDEIEDETGD